MHHDVHLLVLSDLVALLCSRLFVHVITVSADYTWEGVCLSLWSVCTIMLLLHCLILV